MQKRLELESKKVRIFVASASFFKNSSLMKELSHRRCEVRSPSLFQLKAMDEKGLFPSRELTELELVTFAQGCEILVLGRTPLSRDSLAHLPALRVIVVYGVGFDQVDLNAARDFGIEVRWTPGVNRREVAELVIGTMVNHYRNLGFSHQHMRQGQWVKNGGSSLDGKKIGIVGLGAIGSTLLSFLRPWQLDIYYCDIEDRSQVALDINFTSFEELLAISDVVTFHVPLDASTLGMLGRRQIGLMKNDCLLINTSRGAIVDFNAAASAVISNELGGFAVDVYEQEPFDGQNWNHPRIYMTPHIGGNSVQAIQKMGSAVLAHIDCYLNRPSV